MQTKVVWHEMFKDEFEAAVVARPVCYLSFGLSEPHGVLFASSYEAKESSRQEGKKIVASQVKYLKKLSDELLHQAETQQQSERIPGSEAEAIWQEMVEDRPNWISTHAAEGFWEYLEDRRKHFTLPVICCFRRSLCRNRVLRNNCGGHGSPPSIDEDIRYCSVLEGAVPSAPLEMAISQNSICRKIKEEQIWVIKEKKTKAKGNNGKRPSLVQKRNAN